MKFKLIIALILFVLVTLRSFSQEDESWLKQNSDFSGYVKFLNTSTFQNFDAIINDNLIHNRINYSLYLNSKFTLKTALRNRVFWGNSVQLSPNYSAQINQNSAINLSLDLVDRPALFIHSKIDRLALDYQTDKWQITLGRQRINWGKNLVWNPNDLFNTYSFFDFDYEEKPGSDALRIQYLTSGNSSIETAVNYTENMKESTYAVKYNFNKLDYDFQVLLAKYKQDYNLGLGWEGAIKNIGLKGELSYFIPREETTTEENVFVGALTFDYYFKNGTSIILSGLYTSNGISERTTFEATNFPSIQLSAKKLMPNSLSYFVQAGKDLSPAIHVSLSGIYAQELNGFYVTPQFTYNIAQNWDFDTIAQILYTNSDAVENSNIGNTVYFRFRWSY